MDSLLCRVRENTGRYGAEVTLYDALKFLALALMTIDHVGAYFLTGEGLLWCKAVGRACVPVWFFLAGYAQSRKLGGEILWCALFLVPINVIGYQGLLPLNILFNVIFCRFAVQWLNERGWGEKYLFEIFAACVALSPLTYNLFEYGTVGLAYAVMGDKLRRGLTAPRHQLYFALTTLLYLGYQAVWYDFRTLQMMVMVAGVVGISAYLTQFTPRVLPWFVAHTTLAGVVKFFGRNTLYYYTFHRAVFVLAAVAFGFTKTDKFPLLGMFGL